MKAIACELPARLGLPLSRFSRAELRRHVVAAGIVAEISGVTIWRWLRDDAIRPWTHRSWIFPRDPAFAAKAGPVLDLYHRHWHGRPLGPRDFVLSADEKTQIQLTTPRHPITPPAAGQPMRVSSDYQPISATAPVRISPRGTCIAPRSSAMSFPPSRMTRSTPSSRM